MATSFLLISLLVFSTLAKPQVWVQYPDSKEESQVFQKYFRGIKTGYFVQIGGESPIQSSSTIKLSNWQGLIVESDNQKFALLRDFQSHIITLNLEISNVSGGTSKVQGKAGQSSAIILGTADLCHKFYKTTPNILIINAQLSKAALQAYDWERSGCVPDVIYPKSGSEDLEGVLLGRNYVKMDKIQNSAIFIHKNRLQFYRKEALKNSIYLSNKAIYSWTELCESLSTLLGKPFDKDYNARTHPAYTYFRQLSIIDIHEINKYSNLISDVGSNRPLLIMEYDQKQSSIYLGTTNYVIESVNAGKFNFKKIRVTNMGTQQLIYVLDHQKYDDFNVVLKQEQQSSMNLSLTQTQARLVVLNRRYYLKLGSILTIALVFVLSSLIFKPAKRNQLPQGDTSLNELQKIPISGKI